MTPALFAGITSLALLALESISGQLFVPAVERITRFKFPSAEAFAGKNLVFIIALLLVLAVFYRSISPLWPIRGAATIASICKFESYALVLFVPFALLDVVLADPWIYLLNRAGSVWELLSPFLLYCLIGVVLFVLYLNPGIAELNAVTPLRMLAGSLFWGTPLVIILAAIVVVIRNLTR